MIASLILTWFLIPHTTGDVGSLTSRVGFKYLGAGLVGFFELLAYAAVKDSHKAAVMAVTIGIIGSVAFYEA